MGTVFVFLHPLCHFYAQYVCLHAPVYIFICTVLYVPVRAVHVQMNSMSRTACWQVSTGMCACSESAKKKRGWWWWCKRVFVCVRVYFLGFVCSSRSERERLWTPKWKKRESIYEGKWKRRRVVHVLCKCCEACAYPVGLQINPVGFILSEWDSGALQWLSLQATDDCFESSVCPTLPCLPACTSSPPLPLLSAWWRSKKQNNLTHHKIWDVCRWQTFLVK